METRVHDYVNPEARIHWFAAVTASVLAGAIVWLFSHGTPWFTSGMVSPTLMGRDLKAPGLVDPTGSFMTVVAQIVVSICYGLVITPIVYKLRGIFAILAGGVIGLILYALNFLFFHLAYGIGWSHLEPPVILTHVVFTMIAAGLYKGLAARRPRSVNPA